MDGRGYPWCMMKITAEKINGIWWTTINGEKYQEWGPGTVNMMKAIDQAAQLRLPAKKLSIERFLDKLKTRIKKR